MSTFIAMLLCLVCCVSAYPDHASCHLDWVILRNCSDVRTQLLDQIEAWKDDLNCPDGAGEKCLYHLFSESADEITVVHETPVRHYLDDVTFTFVEGDDDESCNIHGFSESEMEMAYLDYSTNYCNMRNLIEGTGLHGSEGFTEDTNDDICTQYSEADCETY